ncbi:hypothetical protein B0J12DRAFT_425182 [Macrophomina phaseolina]|uniref:Uncharacterized protein n=1 Tax=Macrophomina phaseolina TaxID=35725 RepID=A0ABQ8GJL2_9PEZI|nr:hypothetical protein B0J12DRAFT_425182 [Macrophomina phaseolina]
MQQVLIVNGGIQCQRRDCGSSRRAFLIHAGDVAAIKAIMHSSVAHAQPRCGRRVGGRLEGGLMPAEWVHNPWNESDSLSGGITSLPSRPERGGARGWHSCGEQRHTRRDGDAGLAPAVAAFKSGAVSRVRCTRRHSASGYAYRGVLRGGLTTRSVWAPKGVACARPAVARLNRKARDWVLVNQAGGIIKMLPLPRYVTSFIITANSQKPAPALGRAGIGSLASASLRTVDRRPRHTPPSARSAAARRPASAPIFTAVVRSGELRHAHPRVLEIFATLRPPSTTTSRSI